MIGRMTCAALVVMASAACDATGIVQGGDTRVWPEAGLDFVDAAPVAIDAGDAADAGPPAPSPCDDAGDRGDGSTFTDLYRDFFGPSGLATCSARSICHVPGGSGASLSGYMCTPDQTGCWTSMTSSIVPAGGSSDPTSTKLYMVLRKAPPTPGSGPMPRNSSFAFCPQDLDRIKAWIAAGATND